MNEKYIVYFISRTKKKMTSYIERRLKENEILDLVPSYGNILSALYNNSQKLTMKEIGNLVGKDKSTITVLVEKLVKLGYVKKEKSESDKRVTYVILTKKGLAVESKFKSISNEVYERAYLGFSDEEKETFLYLLKKINNNFDID